MTTTAPAPSAQSAAPVHRTVEVQPVSQRRVIASEWVKFRTLRSSWITMGVAVAALALLGLLIGVITNANWAHLDPARAANFNAVDTSLRGINFAQLAIAVLGVLVISGEYSTGMIRSSLGAVPKRLPVLWAKLLVFGAATFVLMEIAAFAAFWLGQAGLATHGTTLSAPGALRSVIGTGLYLTVVGVLSVALGFIIRSTAGGISVVIGLLLVLPGIMNVLPQSWQDHISPYLPSNAGAVITTVNADPGSLAPWTGFGVFCLYAAVAVAISAVLLNRRNA
ncbi:ABC transporter permease subunit [Nakamurella sp. PAMC28650]|uniref:ABC transporter permease subunit n=1 Tax=Nakamurella sp. PAMC28650 TaxID=2762325 RepID=UPI00164D8BF0|nr:ABC transporter permease subunit [Nakamurella sp. PAMC28650]QNK79413.1 ABC transporter permease subunit [Nakamurella sp. PAMC28650]